MAGISADNFNPMIAVKAGAETAQGMFEAERKARAYNALREIYGDVVGPNDTAPQLSHMRREEQMQPGRLTGQSLTNQTLQQNLEQNALMNPLRVQQLQGQNESTSLTNDYNRQTLPGRVTQNDQRTVMNSQTLAQNEQRLQKGEAGLGDDQAERERTAAQGIIAAVKERVERGEDPAAAFDAVAPQVAAMENVDPAQLRSLRDAFVRDPRGTISAMEQYIGAARPNTALMQAQASQTRADAAKAKAAGKGAGSEQAQAFLRQTQENADNIITDILADTGSVSDTPLVRGILGKADDIGLGISGTETRYMRNLQSLRNLLGVEALAQRRQSGLSFGQITEREFDRIAQSVARLENIRDPAEIEREVLRIRGMYRRLLESDPAAGKGAAPSPAAGGAPAADGGEAARRKALLDKYR